MGNSIALENVTVTAQQTVILDNISLELNTRTLAVIGANGSGKSTFAKLLNGLVKPTAGTVRVRGIDVTAEPKLALRQSGFIFPNPDVQAIMPTVIEDVSFSLQKSGLTKAEIRTKAEYSLQKFGLENLAKRSVHTLSSGQKQLLALSAITIREPSLIIADEPTGLLDGINTELVAHYLLEKLEQQVVLVTHNLELAERCEQVLWFADGKLADLGSPDDVITQYRDTFTRQV